MNHDFIAYFSKADRGSKTNHELFVSGNVAGENGEREKSSAQRIGYSPWQPLFGSSRNDCEETTYQWIAFVFE